MLQYEDEGIDLWGIYLRKMLWEARLTCNAAASSKRPNYAPYLKLAVEIAHPYGTHKCETAYYVLTAQYGMPY